MARKAARLYLEHIQEAVAAINGYIAGKTFADFDADSMLRDAVERRIEIISEASRRIPEAMKARHAEVPWRDIAAIGNILRHEYPTVSRTIIWRIATRDLQPLDAAVETLLTEVLRDGSS